jgi:polyhydroxybutyrate depolymerase
VDRRHGLGTAGVVLVVFACSTGSSPSPSASDETRDFVVGGDRPVTVRVPASVELDRPAPLLLLLHGYTSSGTDLADYWRIDEEAEAAGMLYAFPEGTRDAAGDRFWNATDACCDFYDARPDDVGYLAGLISEIGDHAAVDPKRVYVAGHSNGGFMSYRLACDRADLVAAIASLAGATFSDPADCRPSEPVAVLQIHGTLDDTIAYEGGDTGAGAYPGAVDGAETWAGYDGCAATLAEQSRTLDLVPGLAADAGPAETTVMASTGCTAGGHVELWTIHDGDHVPELSDDFGPAVFEFLAAHTKP